MKTKEQEEYDLMVQRAQAIPFSPYAKFMNDTKGRYYKDMETGEHLSRFKVWLRENENEFSLKRIVEHRHAKYVAFDKDGWQDGVVVDKKKAAGDRVKVREDLKPNQHYGCLLLYGMYETLQVNPIVTILSGEAMDDTNVYHIAESKTDYLYSEEMFEGLAEEPTKEVSHNLDSQPSRLQIAAIALQGLLASTPSNKKDLELWIKFKEATYPDIPVNRAYAKEALILADYLIEEEQETRK